MIVWVIIRMKPIKIPNNSGDAFSDSVTGRRPMHTRSNYIRTPKKTLGSNDTRVLGILSSVNQHDRDRKKKKGMGLALKFALPIIIVFIGVISLFTVFIARTSSESIANEILKSGLAQVTLLSDFGSMIIEKSNRTFFNAGTINSYKPWPVDLGLTTTSDFLKRVASFDKSKLPKHSTASYRMSQKTLYASRTGGLLNKIISYRSIDGVLHESQTLAAYILVGKDDVLERYLNPGITGKSYNEKLLLLARSEMSNELEEGQEGVLPIVKSNWIDNYADISQCTIGDKVIRFNTPQTPCIVYGGIVKFSGAMHSDINKNGKEVQSLIFDIPIYDNQNNEVGRAIIAVRASQIVERMKKTFSIFAFAAIIAIILSIITSLVVGSIITRPVRLLINDMDIVASGDLTHKTASYSTDEIGLIASEFDRITRILKDASDNEKKALRMENELDMAREIQLKLLPPKLPEINGIDIFAAYQPAKEVGGDYYDFFPIDDTHYGLVVADVSGKGVPGSMVMATTRTILRFAAKNNLSSAETLIATNTMVSADIKRGMFVTALYIILDCENHSILCSSAGHNPMVLHHSNGEIDLVNPNGIALGFDKGEMFGKTLKEKKVQLQKGDRVILYTDGIIESRDTNRDEFSEQRFYDFIRENSELNSEDFVQKLIEEVESHQGKSEQHDDITILTFRVL